MAKWVNLEGKLAAAGRHQVRRARLPRVHFHPLLDRFDLRIGEDRLGLAGVHDHQAVEGLQPHQVERHDRVRQHRLGIERGVGRWGCSAGGDHDGRVRRELEFGQEQAKAVGVEDAGMAGKEDHDLVLGASSHGRGDLPEGFVDLPPGHVIVRQEAPQPRIARGIKSPGAQDLADPRCVGPGILELSLLVLVAAHAQGHDVQPAGVHRPVVGDLHRVGEAGADALATGHHGEPVHSLHQPGLDRDGGLSLLEPCLDRALVVEEGDVGPAGVAERDRQLSVR